MDDFGEMVPSGAQPEDMRVERSQWIRNWIDGELTQERLRRETLEEGALSALEILNGWNKPRLSETERIKVARGILSEALDIQIIGAAMTINRSQVESKDRGKQAGQGRHKSGESEHASG